MSPRRPQPARERLGEDDFRPRGLDSCPHRSSWIVVRVGPDICFQYCPECVLGQWWSEEDGPIDRSEAGLDHR
jgi:hypothetical protein